MPVSIGLSQETWTNFQYLKYKAKTWHTNQSSSRFLSIIPLNDVGKADKNSTGLLPSVTLQSWNCLRSHIFIDSKVVNTYRLIIKHDMIVFSPRIFKGQKGFFFSGCTVLRKTKLSKKRARLTFEVVKHFTLSDRPKNFYPCNYWSWTCIKR